MGILTRLCCIKALVAALCCTPARAFLFRLVSFRTAYSSIHRTSNLLVLHASSDIHSTAADQARRDEEKRRIERRKDVVIGQTSAKTGAKDYDIDPRLTEEAWLSQASQVERQVFKWTEQGMEALKMLRLDDASKYFNNVFEVKPQAYLWQAGIVKFYMEDYEGAAQIFARNAEVYESRFDQPATEERIWRDACALKMYSNMNRNEKKLVDQNGGLKSLLATIRETEHTADLLQSERRKVIRTVRDMFIASIDKDFSNMILARAKLRSIGGAYHTQPKLDRKLWKLNAWYYLGLHYDVLAEYEESKKCMKMALGLCPSSGTADDIVHSLPVIHMSRRDWFDDDEFPSDGDGVGDDRSDSSSTTSSGGSPNQSQTADPILIDSIKSSLQKIRRADLQEALKRRGIPSYGSKEEMQQLLFESLITDAGLAL
jgi:tetratricopeptide (TPR) repeat protein